MKELHFQDGWHDFGTSYKTRSDFEFFVSVYGFIFIKQFSPALDFPWTDDFVMG
jgi:hypothetical protein